MKFLLVLLFWILTPLAFSQGYKSFNSEFFKVGDSVRVDVRYAFNYCWGLEDSVTRGKYADSLLTFLKVQTGISISINAHTDSRGSAQANKELSVGRANSMRSWLIKEGIHPSRLSAFGWGEGKPIITEKNINVYRRTDRNKFDSLHSLNRRLTVIISNIRHKTNCNYPRTAEAKLLKFYQMEDTSTLRVGDRFRLDFVKFDIGKITVSNFKEEREKYLELATFIHCNPDLKFKIVAHSDTRVRNDLANSVDFTSDRAKALKKVLVSEFEISNDQLITMGLGSNNPIIPQLIIDQFEDSSEDQEEFHYINRRIELVIADIQQSNEYRIDRTTKIVDLETTRPILYREHLHTMKITTQSYFDSIQVIASEEATIELNRNDLTTWTILIKTNTDRDKIALSVKGAKGGRSSFLTRKIMSVSDLGEKSIYLGEYKLNEDVISSLSDEELFASSIF
ncbi:MAG: OmpA family protein, partial [Crocinitomicaceae bacterium]|nr:OmpA family protein [Crocinitomicaceae bacterium]